MKKKMLSNYDGVLPSYCTQYVDNMFSVFNSHDEARRFSLILIQDTLMLKLLWKQRLTKLFPFWMSLL